MTASIRLSGRTGLIGACVVVLAFLAGCSDGSGTAQCRDNAIAFMGPITGTDGPNGRDFRRGVETAIALRAENGSSAGCPIGLVTFDTQGDPEQAVALARQIVDDPQIIAVIGPSYSGETAAAMPVFEAAGLPVVTASATNSELGARGWRSFHRVVVDDATQGPAAAAFMVDRLAVRSVAVVDDGSLYGRSLAELVTNSLGQRGVVVAPRLQIEATRLDYTSAVDTIRSLAPDAVYFGGVSDPAARLVRQLRDAGVGATFIAGDAEFRPQFPVEAQDAAEGAIVTCPCTVGGGVSAAAREFGAAFERLTGTTPPGYAAEYADATGLVLNALLAGADSRAAVGRFLDSVDVEGITKRLSFDADGQIRSGPVFVFEVRNGDFRQIAVVERGVVTPTE